MQVTRLTLAATLVLGTLAGSASAQQVLNPAAVSRGWQAAVAPVSCPAGTHWEQTRTTRHLQLIPAHCVPNY